MSTAALAAETLVVPMAAATQDGTGDAVGTVSISVSTEGAQFRLALHGLPPGPHGFHIHQNDSCQPTVNNGVRVAAGAAGGHWDPSSTGKHAGPQAEGHLGDLPLLEVASDGSANQALIAPHIKSIEQLRGHALMIHIGGDNYSDQPQALGGGGLRFACGVIPK